MKNIFLRVGLFLLVLVLIPIARFGYDQLSYKYETSNIKTIDKQTFLNKATAISGFNFLNFNRTQNKTRELAAGEIIQSSDYNIEGLQLDRNRYVYRQNGEFKTLNKTYFSEERGAEMMHLYHIYEVNNGVKKLLNFPGNNGTDPSINNHKITFVASNKQADFFVVVDYKNYYLISEDGMVLYFNSDSVPYSERTDLQALMN